MNIEQIVQEYCEENKLNITISSKMPEGYEDAYGTFDVLKNTIYINLNYMKDANDYEILFYTLHELRHAVQYKYPNKFSNEIKESLNYVILYNGVCYYLCDNAWKKCELDGEEDYTNLYLSLPYEMDAYEYAFNETMKYISDKEHKEQLIRLYEFSKPKVQVDFDKLRSVFSEIRDKVNE